ncbi:DUF4258 domain-containing protein [Thiofaba sp. EF100]|uniref:DUF4258 domain-containing protein n=1 Tax=Thiofaba sp. EF100 TaxID=3121274 RepID=UPI003221A270
MLSLRFGRIIIVTLHARQRMQERCISDALLLELIETGEERYKDERRLWIAKSIPGRTDNLICAAVALENALIVKTVMHHFTWEP